jgi:DUF1365 family protein
MPMEIDYDWRFTTPGDALVVHMDNLQGAERIFDATLTLRRRPIDGLMLAGVLARRPLVTLQVIAAIHWQALRLWSKRTPFHAHPRWKTQASAPTR